MARSSALRGSRPFSGLRRSDNVDDIDYPSQQGARAPLEVVRARAKRWRLIPFFGISRQNDDAKFLAAIFDYMK